MKTFHLRWILHESIDDRRQRCVAICEELLPLLLLLKAQEKKQFLNLITGDESLFMLE
jgi:hypothetical protein